jgi:hypothetical protein
MKMQLRCGVCGDAISEKTVHQLTLHFRREHPYTKPISRAGAGRNEWDDHFKGCESCLQWYHIDEKHPESCSTTPVDLDENNEAHDPVDTSSSSSKRSLSTSLIEHTSIEPNDFDFSILNAEERKLIESKTLKCYQCHTNIKSNRITNLASHYFYTHGNMKPAGYGIDDIGEFLICK